MNFNSYPFKQPLKFLRSQDLRSTYQGCATPSLLYGLPRKVDLKAYCQQNYRTLIYVTKPFSLVVLIHSSVNLLNAIHRELLSLKLIALNVLLKFHQITVLPSVDFGSNPLFLNINNEFKINQMVSYMVRILIKSWTEKWVRK